MPSKRPRQCAPPSREGARGGGAAGEGVAAGFEFGAQFEVVVNLSVEDDPEATVGARHRLVAGGREVDDGEAAEAEGEVEALAAELFERGQAEFGAGVRAGAKTAAAR